MKLTVYNQKAKKVSEVELNDLTENNKVNDSVLSQYVYIYLSNKRQGNANTKGRAEVSGGGKKPFKQKGTGRARAGSIRSPIWKGGGITFGPTSDRNWKRKTTKNFRIAAFRNALTKLANEDLVKVVDKIEIDEKNSLTKQAVDMMNDFSAKKITVVTSEKNENLIKAFSNLENGKVVMINKVNPYDLLVGGLVVMDQPSLDYIKEKWGREQ